MNHEDIKLAKRELKAHSQIDSVFGEMCGEILEYIATLEERIAIMSEGGWISVKDKLPDQRIGVLVYCPEYNNVFAGELDDYLKKGQWYFFDDEIHHPIKEEVTHWMPMPKPPKGEEA